jgi:hypothetical protein
VPNYHLTQMILEFIVVFERLETLQTLHKLVVFRMLLADVLLQRMFIAITLVTKRTLRRDLLFVDTLRLIQSSVLVKSGRHTICQFTGQRNTKTQLV